MNRITAALAGAALLSSLGCMHDEAYSFRKALGWEDDAPGRNGVRVKTPSPKDLPQADQAVAERVELVGRKILAQATFTGIEPLFFTIGHIPDNVLFHNGTETLYISEALVKKCQSDAELAAVLCSELGQMVSEKRNAKAVGRDVDPIRDPSFGANPVFPGGTTVDAGRQAELAFHEQKHPRGGAHPDLADAAKVAKELLTGAGYSPAELDRVEPLIKQSDRGEALKKQMARPAPAPEWKK
jgi:hypothetical protein